MQSGCCLRVSVADAPRSDEILVVRSLMAVGSGTDAGQNRSGRAENRGRYPIDAPRLFQTGYYGDEEGRNNSTVLRKLPMFTGLVI